MVLDIKPVSIDDVKRNFDQVFYRGKRNKTLKEDINTIYRILGYKEPSIHMFYHPTEYTDQGKSGKPIITNENLLDRLQRTWAQVVADFKVDLEAFGRTYINIRDPEEHQQKLHNHWKTLGRWPDDNTFETPWSHRYFHFFEFVRPYACGDEFYEAYMNLMNSGVGWLRLNENDAYVVMMPIRIRLDDEGINFHSDMPGLPAVEWARGEPDCFLWGVKFDYDTWDKIVNHKMKAKEAMKITNIEQRSKALQVIGYGDLVKDKYHVSTEQKNCYIWKDNTFVEKTNTYELYSVPGVFDRVNVKVVRYWCPSTGREYFSPVPPEVDKAIDGMAWKFRLTREQFMDMQVEG